MARRTLVGVGCELPGGVAEFVPLSQKRSLLDWDVIVFSPDLSPFLGYHGFYKGKPSLSEDESAKLRESAEHWAREVSGAVRIGKSVFVLLTAQDQVWIDTGERQYSGTGRNRQTTRILAPFHTYQLLPSLGSLQPSEGKELRLADGDNILSDYWKLCETRSMYRVLVESKVSQPLIVTRSGAKVAGALIRLKESAGAFVLLPDVELEADEFFEAQAGRSESGEADSETGLTWSAVAAKFGHQLRDCFFRIDDTLRQGAPDPPPAWSGDAKFLLAAEAAMREELLILDTEIARISERRATLKARLGEEGVLRRLLYEKGPLLEDAIARALRLMGFTADPYRDAKSEFDVVFESVEGRLIGEAEGRDNKPVNIDKLRQLQMNLHEDLAREEVSVMAQGVLFGNAYRLKPPSEREDFFTEKVMAAAKQNGCVLVRTPDLFTVAQYLSRGTDTEFASACRTAIISTKGRVATFPPLPVAESSDGESIGAIAEPVPEPSS
jgi:hypothetical protein